MAFLQEIGIKIGMKVEVEDTKNKQICCATIIEVKGEKIKIHYDGWSSRFDVWMKIGSKKVHCPGWCEEMEIPLCPPQGNVDHKLVLNMKILEIGNWEILK